MRGTPYRGDGPARGGGHAKLGFPSIEDYGRERCERGPTCIGKARRLELPMRKTPHRERKRTKPAAPAILETPRVAVWSVVEPPVRRPNGHLTLLELERTSCRYPFGDKAPYLYCGKPIRDATSYCPHHCGVVYGRTGGHR